MYKYLIIIFRDDVDKLSMEYITVHLMYKMLKKNEKEVQGDDAAMVLRQGKADNFAKTCYYYGKYGYIVRFGYKAKKNGVREYQQH